MAGNQNHSHWKSRGICMVLWERHWRTSLRPFNRRIGLSGTELILLKVDLVMVAGFFPETLPSQCIQNPVVEEGSSWPRLTMTTVEAVRHEVVGSFWGTLTPPRMVLCDLVDYFSPAAFQYAENLGMCSSDAKTSLTRTYLMVTSNWLLLFELNDTSVIPYHNTALTSASEKDNKAGARSRWLVLA